MGRKKYKIICMGGSFLNRIFKEDSIPGIKYYRVTNLQELYDGTRGDLLAKILHEMPNFVDHKTKFLLSITSNSLYYNQFQAQPRHHNPSSTTPFDPQKIDTFPSHLRRFLTFLVGVLRNNGAELDRWEDRIIFLPNTPRFVFSCCKEAQHIRADHKETNEIVKNLISTEIEYWRSKGTNIIKQKDLSDWLAFIVPELDLVEILQKNAKVKKWFLKLKTTASRKRVLRHNGLVRAILKEIMSSQDNCLHISSDYNWLWKEYLASYLVKDFNPMPKARIEINKAYEFFRP